ncbi:MAG: hypothetical protein R2789_10565 [Microthrixaceae bacterium]
MWNLTLRNLRANLARLVSTAVAVITGTAFVACGLVLTQAIASSVAGNVELQYSAVDAGVVSQGMTADGPGALEGVDAALLEPLEALPEVSGAAGELVASTKLLDSDGDALRSQMLGRSWITDSELNPFTVDEAVHEAEGEIAVDRGTVDRFDISVGDDFRPGHPSGPVEATVVGITSFGRSATVDGGGTVFLSQVLRGAGSGIRAVHPDPVVPTVLP